MTVPTLFAEPGPSSLGSMLMPAQETEWEELIRTGHMTPFGTKVPQKPEKKPRRLVLTEASDFEKYLADQAKLSSERKRLSFKKRAKKKAQSKNIQCAMPTLTLKGKNGKTRPLSTTDKCVKKRLKKLQNHALQIHSKSGIPKEKRPLEAKGKMGVHDGDDSENSDYVPDEELFNPEEEEQEEEALFYADDDSDYELKTLLRQRKSLKKDLKEEAEDDDFFPSSEEEEEENKIGKRRIKRCKDDGDEDCYKQRLRLVKEGFLLTFMGLR